MKEDTLVNLIAYNLFLEILLSVPEVAKLGKTKQEYIERQFRVAVLKGKTL